jgi:hypothetical protein
MDHTSKQASDWEDTRRWGEGEDVQPSGRPPDFSFWVGEVPLLMMDGLEQMGTFDTFSRAVIFQFPIFLPPSHVPFSWLAVRACDFPGMPRQGRVEWRRWHWTQRACWTDFVSPETCWVGQRGGQGAHAGFLMLCSKTCPGLFLTCSITASLHPGSHHTLLITGSFLEPCGHLHCKWCLLGPRNNINHWKTITLHNLYRKKKRMKLFLEFLFPGLRIFLLPTNNETLVCPSGWERLWKNKATHLLVGSANVFPRVRSQAAYAIWSRTVRGPGKRDISAPHN